MMCGLALNWESISSAAFRSRKTTAAVLLDPTISADPARSLRMPSRASV